MPENTNRENASALLRPEEVGPLFLEPLDALSIATQVSTVVDTDSSEYRIPIVTDDPSAAWVNEGDDIPVTNMETREITVRPKKLAALTVVSQELADDSTPAAAQTVGAALVRDAARKLDEAYFGNLASAAAPKGLASLIAGGQLTVVTRASGDKTVDVFTSGKSRAKKVGSLLTHWIANPDDEEALLKLKEATGSNKPLLGSDAREQTDSRIQSLPLLASEYVPVGQVWGVPKARSFVVRRTGTRIAFSDHRYFESEQVAVRATQRLGFGFPSHKSIVLVNLG